ncbi:MAG TPA: hypothetical protein DCY88_00655, partial [Cyanobacteria bacterium UBA11372]|nr:hypothetical protein [Cyanobacteria bacterium UBA11372]
SAPIPAETESAPVAATPSIATSELVASSEIATKGDIAPSKPTEEQESSPTASALTGETPEAVSNITDTALIATGNQVEDTTSASDAPPASDAVAEGEIAKEGDISPSQAITTQQQSSSTASPLTPETSADRYQVTEDTKSTNSLPIEAAAIATASDREASSPEQTEKPTLGDERSTIVLLSSQPEWAYAYWNIPNQEKEKLQQQGITKLALRLYDVTDIDLDRQQPESIAQDDCNEDSRDAYLMIPAGDRDYMVEIGYVAESDRWIGLARSAVVRIPPASDRERQLAEVEFEAMRLLSVPPVSPSILSSSGGRLGVTSLLATSDNGSSASAETTRRGKFRVVADAELSVYGETEPDAKVTIDGRPIEINPTGTFRCQMLCPDGESEFTITAVGADGETDSIQIKLTRQTLKPNRLHST